MNSELIFSSNFCDNAEPPQFRNNIKKNKKKTCFYIISKKQEKTLIKGPCPRRSVERINRNHYKQMPRKKIHIRQIRYS